MLAVAGTRESAARLFAELDADLVVTTYDHWASDLDARTGHAALAADPRAAATLTALAASDDPVGELIVELPAGRREREALEQSIRTSGLSLLGTCRLAGQPCLRLGTGGARGVAQDPLSMVLGVAAATDDRARAGQDAAGMLWAAEGDRAELLSLRAQLDAAGPRGRASRGPGRDRPGPAKKKAASRPPRDAGGRSHRTRGRRLAAAVGVTNRRRARAAAPAAALVAVVTVGLAALATASDGLVGLLLVAVLVGLLASGLLLVRVLDLLLGIADRVDRPDPAVRKLGRELDAVGRTTRQGMRGLRKKVMSESRQRRSESAALTARIEALPRAKDFDRSAQRVIEQVQAYLRLERAVDLPVALPALGRFTASADVLAVLAETMVRERPRVVVESGSGVSTLVLALIARQHDLPTRIVALEHSRYWAAETRALLDRHGVRNHAEVRLAPLERTSLSEHATPWYEADALRDLEDVGLLFVDGPPASTGPHARYPMLPLLSGSLAPDCSIIADDTRRASDNEVVQRWHQEFPDFELHDLGLEKGALLLRRQAT